MVRAAAEKQRSVSLYSRRRRSVTAQAYAMLALPIIGFFVFTIYPIFWTFRWSLFTYSGIPSETLFVGLDNFKKLFLQDFTYWKTWGNTLLFAALKVPIEVSLAMLLALLLNRKIKGSNLFRSIFYLPNVISVAIIGLIFSNLFSYFGIFNHVLMSLGLIGAPIDWFASKGTAMAALVVSSIWNTFGINVMYLLAALTGVPEEIYESAELDGVNCMQRFFHITLPMIAPVFQTILLLSIVGTLCVNELILVLTGGAPGGQTFTVMSYLTKQFVPGFTTSAAPPLGYGCAMSVLTTILLSGVALAYNKFSNKMNNLY